MSRNVVSMASIAAAVICMAAASQQGRREEPRRAPSKAPEAATGKPLTITGEIVDLPCYLGEGSRGADHQACALGCIKAGAPVGLVDSKGRLYLLMAGRGKNAADMAVDYVAKQAKVAGQLVSRGGVSAVMVDSISAPKQRAEAGTVPRAQH